MSILTYIYSISYFLICYVSENTDLVLSKKEVKKKINVGIDGCTVSIDSTSFSYILVAIGEPLEDINHESIPAAPKSYFGVSESWSCTTCMKVNENGLTVCGACGQRKGDAPQMLSGNAPLSNGPNNGVGGAAGSGPVGSYWRCVQCTVMNSNSFAL